jgi:hypothetical protein
MRSDAVNDQSQQQEHKPTTQVAELATLGQLVWVGCHAPLPMNA